MKEFLSFKYILPLGLAFVYIMSTNYSFTNDEIIGILLFVFVLIRLVFKSGYEITIKEILLFVLILQYFIAPSVVYNKYNNDVGDFGYDMKIEKEEYFSFLVGAVISIYVGLFLPLFKTKTNTIELFEKIKLLKHNFKIGQILLITGFASHIIVPFLPSTFTFLGLFLTNLKYVGLFYIYFSDSNKKFIYIFITLAYLVLNIISGGVFIDLFIWSLFIATYFILNKRINITVKVAVLVLGIFSALLVQSIKADYRKVIWHGENIEEVQEEQVFIDLTSAKLQNAATIFEEDNLKGFFSRINQGWILSNVLEHVPKNENFSNGDLFLRELKGIVLPRILAPDKITASGKDVREKFMKYTGRILLGNTTMNVGLISDGYINFGKVGCWIYMFFFGLFINYFIYKIFELSTSYPTLILWLPVLFFYVLRAANDFYMIMNYLVKSSMLLAAVLYLFRNVFYKPQLA